MLLQLSHDEARRFLATYHFTPTDIAGVFAHLGTVQYDPLNPVGRNPDLVLQARVPGYQVDDWQQAAYTDRIIYDAWDKQACLVPVSDWPNRARIRANRESWSPLDMEREAEAVAATLAELDARGPLCSLDFEDQSHFAHRGEWFGPKRVKHILQNLWIRGVIVTHHRKHGRHYYDRAERVIPAEHFNAPPLMDEEAYLRWMVERRAQSMGLMRPSGDLSIWTQCGNAAQRAKALAQAVEAGTLTPVQIGEKGWKAYLPTAALPLLEQPLPAPRVIFLGPLDSLLWDRKTVQYVFDYDYIWEVYKPEKDRRWGYYVLPVFYGDRFIARLDSRLERGIWKISRWWWEPEVTPSAEVLDALRSGAEAFCRYLHATGIEVAEGIDPAARQALAGGAA